MALGSSKTLAAGGLLTLGWTPLFFLWERDGITWTRWTVLWLIVGVLGVGLIVVGLMIRERPTARRGTSRARQPMMGPVVST